MTEVRAIPFDPKFNTLGSKYSQEQGLHVLDAAGNGIGVINPEDLKQINANGKGYIFQGPNEDLIGIRMRDKTFYVNTSEIGPDQVVNEINNLTTPGKGGIPDFQEVTEVPAPEGSICSQPGYRINIQPAGAKLVANEDIKKGPAATAQIVDIPDAVSPQPKPTPKSAPEPVEEQAKVEPAAVPVETPAKKKDEELDVNTTTVTPITEAPKAAEVVAQGTDPDGTFNFLGLTNLFTQDGKFDQSQFAANPLGCIFEIIKAVLGGFDTDNALKMTNSPTPLAQQTAGVPAIKPEDGKPAPAVDPNANVPTGMMQPTSNPTIRQPMALA